MIKCVAPDVIIRLKKLWIGVHRTYVKMGYEQLRLGSKKST